MVNYMEIVDVSKSYKHFLAVNSVSLHVKKGEFLTILGPSGSGKTSLLKLIAGFEKITSGNILLNNEDISAKKVHERNIGMVFQNYALFPTKTVSENIAYPLRLRKVPKSQVNQLVTDALRMVKLEDLGARYPNQLSGGQQQRVALARAIVFNPSLLLLDEPLSALDKNLREHMQLEIKHIQEKSGITTISVTHDQKEALTMSDRICVMNEGKIEQIAAPEILYKYPKNRFVAEFIGEINLLEGRVVDRKGEIAYIKLADQRVMQVKVHEDLKGIQSSMLIAIRPENIQLAVEEHAFQNSLKVTPIEMIYMGEGIKVLMKTEDGLELSMKIPSIQSELVSVGRDMYIGWNSEDATLIEEKSTDSHLQLTS